MIRQKNVNKMRKRVIFRIARIKYVIINNLYYNVSALTITSLKIPVFNAMQLSELVLIKTTILLNGNSDNRFLNIFKA